MLVSLSEEGNLGTETGTLEKCHKETKTEIGMTDLPAKEFQGCRPSPEARERQKILP